jgi:hypothetical protein
MRYRTLAFLFLATSFSAFGQHLVVTAEGQHGAAPPEITLDDVTVEVNKQPARLEKLVPLRGDEAALQFFIVIDDGTDADVGVQFGSLRTFINSQPASTEIGLAYMRNGAAMIAAPMTHDHSAVEKALRIPLAEPGISASPYMAVSDLVKKWPAAGARREMLLITSGIDPWSPPDPQNPYLQKAIADSQRAGILVHSIYYPGAGHQGHSYWRSNWGQNYLSELGDETGGEAYWQGTGSPVSFDPFLKDLAQRLNHQYLLTLAPPDAKPGSQKPGLQPVRVSAAHAKVSLVAASRINFEK